MNAPLPMTATAAAAQTVAHQSELDRLLHGEYSPRYMLEGDSMGKMMSMAEQMAKSKVSVPDHLKGSPADCLAIVTQAMLWNMNPFAVAQKTHIVSGRLGYEAQLVIAVVQNSGAIRGALRFEYRGTDEVRCGGVLRGETEVTWGEWLSASTVTTKNSPLWKTNPRQQMSYLQAKNWARLYCPGAILGVYSVDELEDYTPAMSASRRADPVTGEIQAPPPKPELPACLQEDLDRDLPKMQKIIDSGKKTAAELLATMSTKATFTEAQRAQILALKPKAKEPEPAAAPAPAADDFAADYAAAEAQQ